MSSLCMNWARKAKVSPPEKIVLFNLADDADKYGRVHFSLEGLAKDCGLPLTGTRACLDELIDKKLILLKPSDMPPRKIDFWLEAQLLIQRKPENQ